ncbi:hypothetical protein VPJ68_01950, partial [Parabacteroides distasonis]
MTGYSGLAPQVRTADGSGNSKDRPMGTDYGSYGRPRHCLPPIYWLYSQDVSILYVAGIRLVGRNRNFSGSGCPHRVYSVW